MFRFSEWSKHSLSSVLPQNYPRPCSNSLWFTLQGMRVGVVSAVNLCEHKLGVLASMID